MPSASGRPTRAEHLDLPIRERRGEQAAHADREAVADEDERAARARSTASARVSAPAPAWRGSPGWPAAGVVVAPPASGSGLLRRARGRAGALAARTANVSVAAVAAAGETA